MKPKRLLALGVFLAGVTAAASLTGAQKPAPPQPTEQQKLKERVDALESQLKEAQAKADRAAMEKEYIERIQKESKDYYDKVLSTQTWTLTIVGIVLTAVFGLTARFGFGIFDRRIQDTFRNKSTQLETDFDHKLADELRKLRDSNIAQIKELSDDLNLRGSQRDYFNQGLALAVDENYDAALSKFRSALRSYKFGKRRHLFDRSTGEDTLHDLFVALQRLYKDNVAAAAKEELADELYNDLEDELNAAALRLAWLAPLVRERKPGAPAS